MARYFLQREDRTVRPLSFCQQQTLRLWLLWVCQYHPETNLLPILSLSHRNLRGQVSRHLPVSQRSHKLLILVFCLRTRYPSWLSVSGTSCIWHSQTSCLVRLVRRSQFLRFFYSNNRTICHKHSSIRAYNRLFRPSEDRLILHSRRWNQGVQWDSTLCQLFHSSCPQSYSSDGSTGIQICGTFHRCLLALHNNSGKATRWKVWFPL